MAESSGKTKISNETPQQDAGVDELLAALGYKVRSSDMAEVSQKLEQLEMALGNAKEDAYLSSEPVHYNPSDLATLIVSMISEHNPNPNFDPISAPPAESSTITTVDFPNSTQIYDESSLMSNG